MAYLANVQCNGCREDHCLSSDCIVPECTKSQDINFCYECKEFPCDKMGFSTDLKEKWIRKTISLKRSVLNNISRMKRIYPITRVKGGFPFSETSQNYEGEIKCLIITIRRQYFCGF
ncbi:MAG: DUF3795 domain-containing protein [Firmicutes bacterium]|nr:DUF3795 domain-containing protein [Bacillota bacterium]